MSSKAQVGRVRAVVAAGLVLVVIAFVLGMSGSAPRLADSSHVSADVFSAVVPGEGTLCQPVAPLPSDAARVSLLVGTYGRRVPPGSLRFVDAAGRTVAYGDLPAGSTQGDVSIPIIRASPAGTEAKVCLHIGGNSKIAIAGQALPSTAGSEVVNGKPQLGVISLSYFRRGSETWWQLLPTVSHRFGLGKALFLGTWTLPLMALLLLAIWIAAFKLLDRELR